MATETDHGDDDFVVVSTSSNNNNSKNGSNNNNSNNSKTKQGNRRGAGGGGAGGRLLQGGRAGRGARGGRSSSSSSFGRGTWAKPKMVSTHAAPSSNDQQQQQDTAKKEIIVMANDNNKCNDDNNIYETIMSLQPQQEQDEYEQQWEQLGAMVAQEMEHASTDSITTAIVSTAAASLLAESFLRASSSSSSCDAAGAAPDNLLLLAENDADDDKKNNPESIHEGLQQPALVTDQTINNKNNDGNEFKDDKDDDAVKEEPDFHSRFSGKQQSLSDLLAEYGEYDPHWQEKQYLPVEEEGEQQPVVVVETAVNHATGKTISVVEKSTTCLENQEPSSSAHTSTSSNSMLAPHGKAPIHVQFVSFGYHYGAPSSMNSKGWSYSEPLPIFDCRGTITLRNNNSSGRRRRNSSDDSDSSDDDEEKEVICLPTVPGYLAWQNGLSGHVRRALLFPLPNPNGIQKQKQQRPQQQEPTAVAAAAYTKNAVKRLAEHVAMQTAQQLVAAIDEGGFGYAMPLHMTVYIGSDHGKHRSVLVAEQAAIALRSILRKNPSQYGSTLLNISQPSSVGTRHRDIEQQQQQQRQQLSQPGQGGNKKKQKDLDDE